MSKHAPNPVILTFAGVGAGGTCTLTATAAAPLFISHLTVSCATANSICKIYSPVVSTANFLDFTMDAHASDNFTVGEALADGASKSWVCVFEGVANGDACAVSVVAQ